MAFKLTNATTLTPWQSRIGLAVIVALCFAASAVGGLATASSVGGWFQTLAKPPFNPPDWVFGPVWTVLYLMMAIAAWRVWRLNPGTVLRAPLVAFAVQLGLNLLWSVLFFGLQRPDLALMEILVLLAMIITTTVLFWHEDKIAGWLFVPYAAWVAFATILNASIWWLN